MIALCLVQFATSVEAQPPRQLDSAQMTSTKSYAVAGSNPQAAAQRLEQRFSNTPSFRVVIDPRSNRLVVQATAEVHQQIRAQLAPTSIESRSTQRFRDPGVATREVRGQIKNVGWRKIISAVDSMSPRRLVLNPVGQELETTLSSRRGDTSMRLNPTTGEFSLRGTPELTKAWLEAIRSLDRSQASPATRLVELKVAKPRSVNRAVDLLKQARVEAARNEVARQWSADVVGIEPGRRQPVQIAQAPAQPLPGAGGGQPNNEQPEENQPPANPQPGAGQGGPLIGNIDVEYVEGLDALIIKGRPQDVEWIMTVIDDLERISEGTEPDIQLVPLQHVNSEAMADLVRELNTQALAVRLGTVNITPLVKPNALLLVGRKEAVEATKDLVARLDQPVEPSSQFTIFRLKHLPAVDAVETVETFFAERGGLGPRFQLQADYRTNSLIVYASPRDIMELKRLLEQIDVTDNAAESEIRVFKLKNALADELAPVLEATLRGQEATASTATQGVGGTGGAQQQGTDGTLSGRSAILKMIQIDAKGKKILKSGILTEVRVAADVRANSLVVTAPAESMELIEALVEKLDTLPTSESSIKVFSIVNGDAFVLVEMLNELFGDSQQGNQQGPAVQSASGESSLVPLRFSTDLRTNSIIATGSLADLAVVEAILLRLDEEDKTGRRNRVYRLQNAPAQDVASAISQFLQSQRDLQQQIAPDTISPYAQIEREVIVVPELVSNSLIISATPKYFDDVAEIIMELDERPPMVLIQVLIAEVDLGNTEELGVELGIQDSLLFDRGVITDVVTPGFNFNNQPLGNSSSATSLATRENTAGQALSSFGVQRSNNQLGYGGLVLSASSESVNILVRALQDTRRLDVLSRPQVMTLNNQAAFVLVGARVPRIQSTSQTQFGIINNTILENVGLLLGVTPRISPDGLVVMEVDAEKSELGPDDEGIPISINSTGEVIRSPIINTTVAQTTVSARSGQTVILGGLITKNRSVISRRVPFLGDIPVLGSLFRFDSVDEGRTELLIILTPYIVRRAEDAEWLNQVETQRMSWCLADVVDLHGDQGLSAGGVCTNQIPTKVVYPEGETIAPGEVLDGYQIEGLNGTQQLELDPETGEYLLPGSIREAPAPADFPTPLQSTSRTRTRTDERLARRRQPSRTSQERDDDEGVSQASWRDGVRTLWRRGDQKKDEVRRADYDYEPY